MITQALFHMMYGFVYVSKCISYHGTIDRLVITRWADCLSNYIYEHFFFSN